MFDEQTIAKIGGMSISSAQGSSASREIAVWRSQMSATFFMKTKEAMTNPTATAAISPAKTVSANTMTSTAASERGW